MKQVNMLLGLTKFKKYSSSHDEECNWEHDVFYATGIEPSKMHKADVEELEKLGWSWDEEMESWSHFN